MIPYVDTHAHLSALEERGVRPEGLLDSLFSSGFRGIVDIGTTAGDLAARIERFGAYEGIRYSAGIWPDRNAIAEARGGMEKLERAIASAPSGTVVAVGECGIDRHWNRSDQGADIGGERELFEAQALLARRLDLPLIVHSREAAEETAAALAAVPGVRGVVHCFSYGPREAGLFLDLGFYVSFAGTVTFKNAEALREAAGYVSEDRLLLETDCPYLAPVPHRGKTAHPGMVEYAYRAVAERRRIGEERLAEVVAGNARRLFGFPAP